MRKATGKSRPRHCAPIRRWQLQEAKAKFSEVFDRAYSDGPQVVTRRNKKAVVILPEAEYAKLANKHHQHMPGIVETFLAMPKVPGFKIPERDKNDAIPSRPALFN